eukprot:TRINITY_DN539_c0_g1_i1.p1 TRINITY_DN539_c0_g1~~TRINITY_DN539_c0_g1_i1.p1  ORF type:complete len:307 (+),score=32.40 TRINITY_DN539_c0_g1_i1:174-1094(+)
MCIRDRFQIMSQSETVGLTKINSVQNDMARLASIKTISIVELILSFCLIIYSYLQYNKLGFPVTLFMFVLGIISVVSCTYGLFAVSMARSELNQPVSGNNPGKFCVHIYFYISLVVAFILVFLGLSGMVTMEKGSELPDALFQNPEVAAKILGTKEPKEAHSSLMLGILLTGILCLLCGFVNLIISYQAYAFDSDIDSRLGKSELVAGCELVFAALLMCFALTAKSTFSKIEGGIPICPCWFSLMYWIGLVLILVSFCKLIALYIEGKSGIKIFSIISHVLCVDTCLLYTSPSPRDLSTSRMPSSA